ncbi:MAG: TraB/GumN family protein [Treponema sp.]|jgi:pheromone shutdown-related protein TraB|nr:TraB/GumN family protein [Treponema sp.]
MNDTCINIKLNDREIILIGTAHISKESIDEVSQVIHDTNPDMICVELDEGRYASVTQPKNYESMNIIKVFREGKGFLLMANLVLSSFQRRLGNELGVKPGDEMRKAIDLAKELNIPYSLCDREIQTTLRRAWARCGFWSKSKLLASLVSSAVTSEKLSEEEIEGLKKQNELDDMMGELSKFLPAVKETLIDERDQYLASKIWTSGGKKSVAVVGAGHMGGIKTHLEKIAAKEENDDVSALNVIPPSKGIGKIVGWIIPALIVALIVYGFFQAGADVSLNMLLHWVLLNGSLAALGTLLCLGHPLAILVSFIGAPIATINPFIGVGLFAGITQAAVLKPRVQDAQNLAEDVSSLKGIYRNRITKALLVFLLSSIGGMIGNFISIPSLAGTLFG